MDYVVCLFQDGQFLFQTAKSWTTDETLARRYPSRQEAAATSGQGLAMPLEIALEVREEKLAESSATT